MLNIKTLSYSAKNKQAIKDIVDWEPEFDLELEQTVRKVIQSVRQKGDKALLLFTNEYDKNSVDHINKTKITKEKLIDAWENISESQRSALIMAKERIENYAKHQSIQDFEIEEYGGRLGQRVTPMDSAGLYVPGGMAAYPSSVLMNSIPAKVAGVKRLVMVTPAMYGEVNPLILATAFLCEVDEIYTIGGAQAVAALAYGTETIQPVDIIVGPGNAYVATAKKYVFGKVAIDMIAGPSEVTIIADGSCDPDWVAADLFAQSEHDTNAQAILITNSKNYAKAVSLSMQNLINELPRKDIITESINQRGAIILVEDMEQAAEVSNLIAPEHLELLVKKESSEELLSRITHAGAIFVGNHSCEVLGDYIAGPNHVLPTSGTARFSSPLGVYNFQKRTSIIQLSDEQASNLAEQAEVLANSEGLGAHALSAKYRIKS